MAAVEVDPRVERSRRVVLAAALDLLGEVGYGGLTVEAVAARAGVGKSTVYRHWTGKLDLVEDAVRTLKAPILPPTEGTVRERITALLTQVAAAMADSTWSSCLPAIVEASARDDDVREVHCRLSRERRQVMVDLLAEGVASGEIPADVDLDLLSEVLIGPLVVRRLMLHDPLDPAQVPAVVELVLGPPGPPGLVAPAPRRPGIAVARREPGWAYSPSP